MRICDGGAQVALAGDEGLGQRDQGAEGEDVVPGGDRVQRDPVGRRLDVGAGAAQPRAGGEDALGGRAEIEEGLGDRGDRVGALARARALDDVERVVGEFAGEHAIGGDAEVDGREPRLPRLLERRHRLVLARRRFERAGMTLDRVGDDRAEQLAIGLLAAQAEHRIGVEIDRHRLAGRVRQRIRRRRGPRRLGERRRAHREPGDRRRKPKVRAHDSPREAERRAVVPARRFCQT